MKRLLRVVAPHFVAGAVWEKHSDEWRCTHAAPILRWMIGKPPGHVLDVLLRKGYEWKWL
jgi:hypothetical protein